MFRQFGKDSLLLATLAYNVGSYRLLVSGKIPNPKIGGGRQKHLQGIYRLYNYKGKRYAMLLKRRKSEFVLLYVP